MINMGLHFWTKIVSGGGGSISFGRSVSLGADGVNPSFTVGFTGSAPIAGTWIYMIIISSTTSGVPSGGSAWTQIDTASGSQKVFIWTKKCGASEPTTYTITYNGAGKSDGATISMVEILSANSTNPDAHGYAASTTPPPEISASATDVSIVGWAGGVSPNPTAPAGYTIITTATDTTSALTTSLATKINVGAGTITPGSWTGTGVTGTSHCLFKP